MIDSLSVLYEEEYCSHIICQNTHINEQSTKRKKILEHITRFNHQTV